MQINKLQGCYSKFALDTQLKGLPSDLNEFYDRIVTGLNEMHRDDALKILQWLSFSIRPLKLAEVAQVACVVPDVEQGLVFDPSRVFMDPRSVLNICSSFVAEVDGAYLKWSNNFSLTKLYRVCQAFSHVSQGLLALSASSSWSYCVQHQ